MVWKHCSRNGVLAENNVGDVVQRGAVSWVKKGYGMWYTDPRTMCKRGSNAVGTTRGKDDVEEPKGRAIGALQWWWWRRDKSDGREVRTAFTTSADDDGCQECYKNSALFAQFLLSFLTYVLLFYFVHLHCTNIHTPLPFLSYPYDFQNIKTRHSNLFGARENL